jgi:endogenous inhibitor of DNA gyrase (YacG/DUF329 family)
MEDEEPSADCPACGQEVAWSEWGGAEGECECPHCGHLSHADELFPLA